MSKVYIIYSYSDDWSNVEAVCSSFLAAENKKQQIERHIADLKEEYKNKYSVSYEEDREFFHNGFDHDDWDERADRFCLYKAQHNELRIEKFNIVETYLIEE